MGLKTIKIPGAESNAARANAVLTALAAEFGDEWTVDLETLTITHSGKMGIRFYTDNNNNSYVVANNPYTSLSSASISGLGNGTNAIYVDILTANDEKTIALSFRQTSSNNYTFCIIWYQNEDGSEGCIVTTATLCKLLYENDRTAWDIVSNTPNTLSCWAFCRKPNVTSPTAASSLYEAMSVPNISRYTRLQNGDQKFIGFCVTSSGSTPNTAPVFAVPVDSFDVENI